MASTTSGRDEQMRLVVALLLSAVIALTLLAARPRVASAANCRFVAGFQTLHDLIPSAVGQCLDNERYNPSNGNGYQATTGPSGQGGLLVWRKADNVATFTDGYRTWLIGPFGLQQRLNTQRFAWEVQSMVPLLSSCRSGDPLANVHDPQRLTVLQTCVAVTGTVTSVTSEPDGDVFIDLKPELTERRLLNQINVSQQNGNMVLEIVPADQPGCTVAQPTRPGVGSSNFGICTGANIPAPRVGADITAVGPYARDENHGWIEIHPVWAIFDTVP